MCAVPPTDRQLDDLDRRVLAHLAAAGRASMAALARVGVVVRTADVAGYVRRLSAMPGVTEIESVTGEYDLMVLVTAPSAGELDVVLDGIQGWRETVRTITWV